MCHDAQRAVLHVFMEDRNPPDPTSAREVLDACGLAVKYTVSEEVEPDGSASLLTNWGNRDDPFLGGGKRMRGAPLDLPRWL